MSTWTLSLGWVEAKTLQPWRYGISGAERSRFLRDWIPILPAPQVLELISRFLHLPWLT